MRSFDTMSQAYEALVDKRQEIADLASASALLSWDQEVLMPAGASARRARQLGTLASLQHKMTVEELPRLLGAAEAEVANSEATQTQRLNVQRIREDLTKQQKLPAAFVADMAETSSRAQRVWEGARAQNDFASFQPWLEKIVALKQQEAQYYGYIDHPYDALLDSYEPGVRTAKVQQLFDAMKPRLKALLDAVMAAPQVDDSFLMQPIGQDLQMAFSASVLRQMGYSFEHGRQDLSAHPFCTSFGMEDVRITTRYRPNDIGFLLYSSIHEGGHALYEQGLKSEAYGMPEGEACSLSIHESMSRMWENNIARSEAFWNYFYPSFSAIYPDGLKGQSAERVFAAVNKVAPSLIRIEADELSYHFHIFIRFEIEQALVAGTLAVRDLPAYWNAQYKNYLGVTVPNDAHGVLQDVHWSLGAMGYFATYSLGSFYAAQFLEEARKQLPNLDEKLAVGEFHHLREWLQGQIYDRGRLHTSDELCTIITGRELDPEPFVRYISAKLAKVYGVHLVV
jgi:carboxypeptidase Taq